MARPEEGGLIGVNARDQADVVVQLPAGGVPFSGGIDAGGNFSS